jgi:hypothetical protein
MRDNCAQPSSACSIRAVTASASWSSSCDASARVRSSVDATFRPLYGRLHPPRLVRQQLRIGARPLADDGGECRQRRGGETVRRKSGPKIGIRHGQRREEPHLGRDGRGFALVGGIWWFAHHSVVAGHTSAKLLA